MPKRFAIHYPLKEGNS